METGSESTVAETIGTHFEVVNSRLRTRISHVHGHVVVVFAVFDATSANKTENETVFVFSFWRASLF